jgi:hypothetical protein
LLSAYPFGGFAQLSPPLPPQAARRGRRCGARVAGSSRWWTADRGGAEVKPKGDRGDRGGGKGGASESGSWSGSGNDDELDGSGSDDSEDS